jgi:hypothetical protein
MPVHFDLTLSRGEPGEIIARLRMLFPTDSGGVVSREWSASSETASVGAEPSSDEVFLALKELTVHRYHGAHKPPTDAQLRAAVAKLSPGKARQLVTGYKIAKRYGMKLDGTGGVLNAISRAASDVAKSKVLREVSKVLKSPVVNSALMAFGVPPNTAAQAGHMIDAVRAKSGAVKAAAAGKHDLARALDAVAASKEKQVNDHVKKHGGKTGPFADKAGKQIFYLTLTPGE